jgi:autotransporter-associated beta strand protein
MGSSASLWFGSSVASGDVDFRSNINLGATGSRSFTLLDNVNTTFDFATVSGVISGSAGLTKNGAGMLILSGANTYSGDTILSNGILVVRSIGTAGATSSNLGTNVGGGSLWLQSGGVTSPFIYAGSGEVTTRPIVIGNVTAQYIEASGSGPLEMTKLINAGGYAANKSIYLKGVNTDQNTISSVLADSGTYTLAIVKTDGGVWALAPSSPNTFTGGIFANNGLLGLTANGIGSSYLSFGGGGIFAVGGSLISTGSVLLNTSAAIFAGSNSIAMASGLIGSSGVSWTINNSMDAGASLTIGSFNSLELTNATRSLSVRGLNSTRFNGVISDGSMSATQLDVSVANSAAVVLSGLGSFSGGVLLRQGTLLLDNPSVSPGASALGAVTGTLYSLPGQLQLVGGELRSNYAMTGSSAILNFGSLFGDVQVIGGSQSIEFAGTISNSQGNRTLQNDIQNGGSLILSGQINLSDTSASRTFTLQGAGNTWISGSAINGTLLAGTSNSNMVYQGAGTLNITGSLLMTGSFSVNRGTVVLSGSSGGAISTGSMVVVGSLLRLDDSGGVNPSGRLPAAGSLLFSRGTLELVGNSSTISTGSLVVAQNAIFRVGGTGSNSIAFTASSISSPNSTIDLTGVPNLGTSNLITIATGTGGGLASSVFGNVIPRVVLGNDFAKYDPVAGFVPLGASDYSSHDFNSLLPTETGSLSAGGTLLASGTVNALKLSDGTYSGSTKNLNLASGGLLVTGTNTTLALNQLRSSSAPLFLQVSPGAVLNLNTAINAGTVNTGTAQSIIKTQDGTLILNSNNFGGPFAVAGGSLVLNAGLNTIQAGTGLLVEQGGTVDLGGNAQYLAWLNSGGSNMPGNGGNIVSNGSSTGLLAVAAGSLFSGVLGGSLSLASFGTGNQIFQLPQTYKGSTLRAGGLLYLYDDGSILNTSRIELSGNSTLYLGNVSSTQVQNDNRVSDTAPVLMRGATILLYGRTKTAAAETIAPVTLAMGANTFTSNPYSGLITGVYYSSDLTLTSLTRSAGATANFTSSLVLGALGNNGRILITQPPSMAVSGVIGPWAIANSTDYAGYNPVYGVGALGQGGFASYDALFGSGKITKLMAVQAGTTTLAAGGTISSMLVIAGTYQNDLAFSSNSDVLNLELGGLMRSNDNYFTSIGGSANSGTLTVGGTANSGNRELVVYNNAGTLTINSSIRDTRDAIGSGSATLSLVKSGGNTLMLTGSNSYTGGTTVSQGSLYQRHCWHCGYPCGNLDSHRSCYSGNQRQQRPDQQRGGFGDQQQWRCDAFRYQHPQVCHLQ